MKGWPLLLLAVLLTGCTAKPVATHITNNPEVPVSLLFEHDGCKMYRFEDNGYYHYYAKCENATSTTSTDQSAGKTTYPEETSTQ